MLLVMILKTLRNRSIKSDHTAFMGPSKPDEFLYYKLSNI